MTFHPHVYGNEMIWARFVTAPTRSAGPEVSPNAISWRLPDGTWQHTEWLTDAHVAFECRRCGTVAEFIVTAAELQQQDPHDNHLRRSDARGYASFDAGDRALEKLDAHICAPGVRYDASAPVHEQYEALAQLFAVRAEATR